MNLLIIVCFTTLASTASSQTSTIGVSTDGDVLIDSLPGKNVLVNRMNVVQELERAQTDLGLLQEEMLAQKETAATNIAALEAKLAKADSAAAEAATAAAEKVTQLTTRLGKAEATLGAQVTTNTEIDDAVINLLATAKVLKAQLYKPTLVPTGGSLTTDLNLLQGTEISLSFAVDQGDITKPSCTEPAGKLEAAGLSLAAAGTNGAYTCAITGTLPTLDKGEATIKFEAVVTDSLSQAAKGAFEITYITNTGPLFDDAGTYKLELNTRVDGSVTPAGAAVPALKATDREQDASELVYKVCGGSLPGGLALKKDGTFSGAAKAVEKDTTFEGKFCVSDSVETHTRSFLLTVGPITTVVFTMKKKDQIFKVPEGVTMFNVAAWGAGGGYGSGAFGGGGGYSRGTVMVPDGYGQGDGDGYVVAVGMSYGSGTYSGTDSGTFGYGGAGYRQGGGSAGNGGGLTGVFAGTATVWTCDGDGCALDVRDDFGNVDEAKEEAQQDRAIIIAGGGGGGGYRQAYSPGGAGGGLYGQHGDGSPHLAHGGGQRQAPRESCCPKEFGYGSNDCYPSSQCFDNGGSTGGRVPGRLRGGVTSRDGNTGGGGGGYWGGGTVTCSYNAGGGGGSGYIGGSKDGKHKLKSGVAEVGLRSTASADLCKPGVKGQADKHWNNVAGRMSRDGRLVIEY